MYYSGDEGIGDEVTPIVTTKTNSKAFKEIYSHQQPRQERNNVCYSNQHYCNRQEGTIKEATEKSTLKDFLFSGVKR
jgi:hypothetical protein